MDLVSFKEIFDTNLKLYLDKKIAQASKIVEHTILTKILEHIRTLTLAGGKRIRPYCAYLTYTMYADQDIEEIMEFIIAFEILHTMALIHDDIIDEASKRHNVATTHYYVDSLLPTSNKRISEGQAILVGDLLLAWVYEILHKEYRFNTHALSQAQQTVHTMIQEVVLGQMLDVELSAKMNADVTAIERKNLYKTARYTFMRPLVAGAQLAQAPSEQISYIEKLGEKLGLAYQMYDDLKDIIEIDSDKNTFHDIPEGQQTLLTQYIMNHENKEFSTLLEQCMGKELTLEQIKALKHMFDVSGANDFGRKKIAEYLDEANKILEHIHFHQKSMRHYIEHLMHTLTAI